MAEKDFSHRDRVLTAFSHQEPDRVPVGFAGLNAGIEERLKAHFGIKDVGNDKLLEALGVDFRYILSLDGLKYTGPELHPGIPDHQVHPFWGIVTRWVEHETGGYWDYCDFPLKGASVEQVQQWPMPNPKDFDYSIIPDMCMKYDEYCIVYGHPGVADLINNTGMLSSAEQVMINLAFEDEAMLLYMKRKAETELAVMESVLEAANGRIDIVWIGEDLGSQDSQIISLDMYHKLIKPFHKRYIDLAISYNAKVMFHSCGSSSWVFEDMIEMGVEIIDTLQPEAKDMSPQHLKNNFGDRLSFHGCISTAGPLAYGSVADINRCVRETLEIMKPGGGYVLAPTHMTQDNTPVQNVIAMYEAALKYGTYSGSNRT
jgi:uroporphyrinogen decarboxylase